MSPCNFKGWELRETGFLSLLHLDLGEAFQDPGVLHQSPADLMLAQNKDVLFEPHFKFLLLRREMDGEGPVLCCTRRWLWPI